MMTAEFVGVCVATTRYNNSGRFPPIPQMRRMSQHLLRLAWNFAWMPKPVSLFERTKSILLSKIQFWIVDESSPVVIWECNQNVWQNWRFSDITTSIREISLSNNTSASLTPTTIYIYLFISRFILTYLDLCLEGGDAGLQVQTFGCNSGENQEWNLKLEANGAWYSASLTLYSLRSKLYLQCFTVKDARFKNGMPLVLLVCLMARELINDNNWIFWSACGDNNLQKREISSESLTSSEPRELIFQSYICWGGSLDS